MIDSFDRMLEKARNNPTMRLAGVAAQDEDTLRSLYAAEQAGLIQPVIFGRLAVIEQELKRLGICFAHAEFVQADSAQEAAELAVKAVRNGDADFIMKGLLDTNIFLKAIVNKESGIAVSGLLSHVMTFEPLGSYHKLIITSDGGMVVAPNLEQKKDILRNAIKVARTLELSPIKVAMLCAKEKVNPKMPATVDAAEIKRLAMQGEFGEDVIVEGPISLDLAISRRAAEIKGFVSPVAGDMDIGIVPSIEAGNLLGKTMSTLYGAKNAGVVVGARVPVVLSSRADSEQSKLYSIALASLMANCER